MGKNDNTNLRCTSSKQGLFNLPQIKFLPHFSSTSSQVTSFFRFIPTGISNYEGEVHSLDSQFKIVGSRCIIKSSISLRLICI